MNNNDDNDDNIIPFRTSQTLTVQQAVMYMLGYRGEYSFFVPHTNEMMSFDLVDYLYHLKEKADSAYANAKYDLWELRQNGDATPEAIKTSEENVESAKAELEKAVRLKVIAEEYRLLINHEIRRIKNGKRTPLVLDEEKSGGQPQIITASFLEWLEGIELEDANESPIPIKLPIQDDDFDKKMELTRKATESLFLTLGLLVSLYAESSGGELGSAQEPNIINIAEMIYEHGKQLNKNQKLHGQGISAIKKRIDVALSALHSNAYTKVSF